VIHLTKVIISIIMILELLTDLSTFLLVPVVTTDMSEKLFPHSY